jgi:prefoldin subunit 5
MKNINENVIDKMKKIVKDKQAMKIDGVMVDLYTASAVTQIYDKVNPANKKKMENMSPQGLATAAFKILGKKESVSEDASGMNPKQKMKFDQLMKKLDGGKEHMKFKRMAKNSVQGDDMFHGYVKDLAMKEQTEITEYTAVSPKMAKVFDSLKVGDKFTYKTKRYSSDGLKVTKKEILRGNLAGVERITVGKGGVYLFKWEKTKELVMRSGNMPITITDLVKESMNETVQINEVQQKEVDALKKLSKDMQAVLQDFYKIAGMGDKELKNSKYNKDFQAIRKSRDTILSLIGKVNTQKILNKESMNETVQIENWQGSGSDHDFSPIQLSRLKKAYSTLKGIDPSSQNYKKLKTWIRKLDVNRLEQLARAKIRFVSTIAAGEYAIKSGKRLHARDYLESTELEESVKISFHSKGAKTKWMKKQGVASKEIINQTPTSIELPSRWKDLSKKKDHDEIFSVVMENDEYDNEGGMALSQLRTAKSAVEDLMSSIKEMDNLPEWVQSKLTKAVDYMDSVRDYMASEEGEEPVEESMARARADARRHMSGRGAQKGMAPLKKDVDNDATDGDRKAASKHIIQQLRKAADLPNGAEVEFKNGKGKVDRNSAQMVLKKYLAIKKPMDKEKFQANIKSLSDVKKILGR